MSFSSEVKEELAKLIPEESCCNTAQAYGLLECGHSFSLTSISLKTENAEVSSVYRSFTETVCGLNSTALIETVRSSGIHIISVPQESDRIKIIERFGHSVDDIAIRINRANFECESCAASYIRGAFLSCGTVTDPNADYHMEFSLPFYRLSLDLLSLMGELGFNARLSRRKGSNIIYLKESGQIEDCLTLMGATNSSLELMGVKMVKDIRNTANRITNCENANIDKTVDAAVKQIDAIRKIEQTQGLDSLPDDLRELALIRLKNPDLSLRELGEQLNVPISRSGVNHRLNRLMKITDNLKNI